LAAGALHQGAGFFYSAKESGMTDPQKHCVSWIAQQSAANPLASKKVQPVVRTHVCNTLAAAERQAGEVGFGGRPPSVVATNLKRISKNTLIGTVDLTVPRWKIIFPGCTWHRKGTKEWVNFGAREWTDRAGTKQYAVLVKFTDDETHQRFQRAALAVVHRITNKGDQSS
jgi:hypothetical protein